ncbi:MAG TPA: GAF domain-containing protein, partial [Ramlibacter sp.]|nr:GAF domain-containing protein [Ramlibacter sp.]
MSVVSDTTAVVESTAAPDLPGRYAQLLTAARDAVDCDAAALLRLDGEVLTPVAVDGLSIEALGRRFAVAAHPRLARLLASPSLLRFPPDCGLPDPYDGLVSDQPDLLAVHDCMGAPLRVDGRIWGLLTLDALSPQAFDTVPNARLQALVRFVESGIAAIEAIRALEERALQEQAMARAWQSARPASRELLGTSPAMQRLREEIDTVAASDLTVLVLGETG